MKKTLFDHLFPSEPEERKQKNLRKKNNSSLHASMLVEGAQAKTRKYATKYAVNVFQGKVCI